MKSAQNTQTNFVYLCKMPFLNFFEKNAKKRLTFFAKCGIIDKLPARSECKLLIEN